MLEKLLETAFPPEIGAEALAQVLGITVRRLSMHAADGIIPKARRGVYPTVAAIQGYVRYLQEAAKVGGLDDDSLSKQRARLTRNKADIAELERSRLLGESMPTNEVIAMNTAIAVTVRTRMLAVPSKFAPRLVMIRHANEVEAILRTGIEEGLEELSRLEIVVARPSVGTRRRGGHARKFATAAEADGLAVG